MEVSGQSHAPSRFNLGNKSPQFALDPTDGLRV